MASNEPLSCTLGYEQPSPFFRLQIINTIHCALRCNAILSTGNVGSLFISVASVLPHFLKFIPVHASYSRAFRCEYECLPQNHIRSNSLNKTKCVSISHAMANYVDSVRHSILPVGANKSLSTAPAIIVSNPKTFLIRFIIKAPIAAPHPTKARYGPRPNAAALGTMHGSCYGVMTVDVKRRTRLKSADERVIDVEPIAGRRHTSRRRNGVDLVRRCHRIKM